MYVTTNPTKATARQKRVSGFHRGRELMVPTLRPFPKELLPFERCYKVLVPYGSAATVGTAQCASNYYKLRVT